MRTQSSPLRLTIQNGMTLLLNLYLKFEQFVPLSSDRIVTGSFDKTAKVWNATTGACLQTFYGHTAEVVAAEFNPSNVRMLATASMDHTARVFHVETGQETHMLADHMAEVIAAHFSRDGNLLLTGSFDSNAFIWDLRSKEYVA